jgi:hypothetical protein
VPVSPPPPSPPSPSPVASQPAEESADFGSRLLKAKQRIWEERERGTEKDQDR